MKVEPFSLPLAAPLSTASGTIDRRRGFIVRCSHRDETGVGDATPLPGWTEPHEACERALTAAVDRTADEGMRAARRAMPGNAVAARHGVSTALLDADARSEGLSLSEWLDDDQPAASVPVNATIGDTPPAETASAAGEAVDAGFDCLKVKVGSGAPERDLERLRAVRRAIGDAPTLRLDANGAWSPPAAKDVLGELSSIGVSYVEQPLAPDDLAGHAALRGGPVGVALDESLIEHDVTAVLGAEAADVLVLKPMVLGGPGAAYAIATRLRDAGVDPVLSTTIDGVLGRTAACHVAATIPEVRPCGLATADHFERDLGPDPAPVSDGRMAVPDGPGLGVTEVQAGE